MDDMKRQSLMSLIEPPEGERLPAYLRSVVAAIGGRSDADLARRMDVPPSAIANWKRRGSIPSERHQWFRSSLLPAIAASADRHIQMSDLAPINAVIEVILVSGGNPLGAQKDPAFATAAALKPLLAWAQFVSEALQLRGEGGGWGDPKLVELTREGAAALGVQPAFARL